MAYLSRLNKWLSYEHRLCIRGDQGQNSIRGRINSSTSEQLEVGSKPRVRINSSTSEQLEVGSKPRGRIKASRSDEVIEVGSKPRGRIKPSRSDQVIEVGWKPRGRIKSSRSDQSLEVGSSHRRRRTTRGRIKWNPGDLSVTVTSGVLYTRRRSHTAC